MRYLIHSDDCDYDTVTGRAFMESGQSQTHEHCI